MSFDATALAEDAGDPIATNMVMIGVLCARGSQPFDEDLVLEAIKTNIPKRYLAKNLTFKYGKSAFRKS